MFVGTQVVEFIDVRAAVIAAIVAVLNLENHVFVKFISMTALCAATLMLVWFATHGYFSDLLGGDAGKILENARIAAARDFATREYQKLEQENQQAHEKQALADAQRAIVGNWKSELGGTMTFHSDATVSKFIPNIYTYKFVDSTHLIVTGL